MLDILIIDDEINICKALSICLEMKGHKVVYVSSAKDGLYEASNHCYDIIFLDLRLGIEDGMDLIPKLILVSPWTKIVIITAYASIESAVEAMKRGAVDYLPKPFTPDQVEKIVQGLSEIIALEKKVSSFAETTESDWAEIDLNSQSLSMQRVLKLSRQVADTDASVLICGESGTGKGVLARIIHSWSKRADKPFGVISCPSLSPELLESELFGHARGSFTGATRDYQGRISANDGGTLFLDEIGELPLHIQPKLLRFLQDREYERIGENIIRRVDVRIIAATNIDLMEAKNEGRFREDLFYRLNVFQIDLPPLRDRVDDIVPLANRFLAFFLKKNKRKILGFTNNVLQNFRSYSWPGNIRELRNVIERASIVCQSLYIDMVDLPTNLIAKDNPLAMGDMISLESLEEHHIKRVLASTESLKEAARILGIDESTLWRRRKKYGI